MSVKSPEASKPEHIGKAIRKYRNETRLTQAQFAVALGVAPTSIYRYEAGTSTPDVGTLQKLYLHADREGNDDAKAVFYSALTDKAGLRITPGDWDSVRSLNPKDLTAPIKRVEVQGRPLTPREQVLSLALVFMLRNNNDESSDKMIRLLLEPWMKAAKDELEST
jgi:DNA-binding XRE family transcriptional regulator